MGSDGSRLWGTNSLVVGLSLELLGELVLVGMECLVKMGPGVVAVGRRVVALGVNSEHLGSKLRDFGTKLAADGFSLFVLIVTVVG